MKRKQLFLLLGVAALAGLAWWKRDQLFGPGDAATAPQIGGTTTNPWMTSLTNTAVDGSASNTSSSNTTSETAAAAAVAAAAATATAATAAHNQASTNPDTSTPAPSTDWGALSVFADAYQTWIARGQKKDRPNTEKNLARFEKRYERKHQVQVGSSVSLAGGVQ